VAAQLEPLATALRSALKLGAPFRDPGVGAFGLSNAVFALGDCFLEVVSPMRSDTPAGRYLSTHGGDGGYMVIFDIEGRDDFERARSRALGLGVRVAWQIELQDIATVHLHPADMRGAIVSLDRSVPYGTWRWGGPQWTGQTGVGAAGRLASVTLAVGDPASTAARWGEVLDVAPTGEACATLALDDGAVHFRRAAEGQPERLVEIAVEIPHELPGGAQELELGGVCVRRLARS